MTRRLFRHYRPFEQTCIPEARQSKMLDAIARFGNNLNPMTRAELQQVCSGLSIGKRLPGACYLARETINHFPPTLKELIDHLSNRAGVNGAFNVLKISWADFAVSFLDYEDFETAAHPLLGESVRICLATG